MPRRRTDTPETPVDYDRGSEQTSYHQRFSADPRLMKILIALLAGWLCAPYSPVLAQEWPTRPITLVVPFAPGGGTDSIARDIARGLADKLPQPVVVDNRGGDGGAIAAAAVARAPTDGLTLLFVTSTFVTHAAATPDLKYDVLKDFAPIAMLGRGPLLVVAANQLGVKTLQQLIALGRQKPGTLNYCSAGNGSINHLAGQMFSQKTALPMTHVPYRGSGPATLDLLAGRVQVFFATVPTILAHVKEGRVQLLAVTGKTRSTLFPDIPTVIESGIAGFEVSTWWGIVAPAGTPQAVITRLNALVGEVAMGAAVRNRLINEGATPFQGSPADFRAALSTEVDGWRAVIKSSGIGLEKGN